MKFAMILLFATLLSGCASTTCEWEQAWQHEDVIVYWIRHCDKTLIMLKPTKDMMDNPNWFYAIPWVVTEHKNRNESDTSGFSYQYYVLEPVRDEDYRVEKYDYWKLPQVLEERSDWQK